MTKIRTAILFALMFLVGPAVAGVDILFDEETDFSGYRTFAWQLVSGAPFPEQEQMLKQAVERELTGLGMKRVEEGAEEGADLRLSVMAILSYSGHVGVTDMGYQGPTGIQVFGISMRQMKEGTLLLGIRDTTDEFVYRAIAHKALSTNTTSFNPQKSRKRIDRVVKQMFETYPTR